MGDLNAKVVKERKDNGWLGSDREPETSAAKKKKKKKCVQCCTANDQIITNIWFQEQPRRLWTWRSRKGYTKNQIDYVTINKMFRNSIL